MLGTGQVPETVQALAQKRVLYLETDSKERPQVPVELVATAGRHVWRIEVPVDERLKGARAGHSLERHPSTKFLNEVDEAVSFKSHRPDWIDAQ